MFRFVRYRSIFLRYVVFCLCIVTMVKVTSIYYYDLQQRTIAVNSSSLPYDTKGGKVKALNLSLHAQIDRTPPMNLSRPVIDRAAINAHRQFVLKKNLEQHIHNRDLYSPTNTRYVLLVQVHKRVVYLRKFIEMLRKVAMINETLVIFSHDFIDPDINALVTNITFVPVRRD